MPHAPRTHSRPIALALWLAATVACAPASDTGHRGDFDRAVSRFVAGDYAAAIEEMEEVAGATSDDAVKREAYTYIGRSHMALGHTEDAITAFTLGMRYGDRGPCVAYLELLKQYVEGSPGSLHIRDVLTRAGLAGAIVRLMDGGAAPEPGPGQPTPLSTLAARGWLPAPPDGREHADDAVTRAALYVVAARLLSDAGAAEKLEDVFPGGYPRAVRAREPVSGAEALAVLERVRAIREAHGR